MSDYTPTTDFSAKDALTPGDPLKKIQGADIDTEFNSISTAVNSKLDTTDLATQAQAEAATSNTTLMTPLRTAQQFAATTFDADTRDKTVAETINNSTTLQNDDSMQNFAISANTTYAITGILVMQLKAASDVKFKFNSSVAPSRLVVGFHGAGPGAIGDFISNDADVAICGTNGTNEIVFQVWGQLVQGGTGGTFSLQWAQNAAVAEDTIMSAGSHLTVSKI